MRKQFDGARMKAMIAAATIAGMSAIDHEANAAGPTVIEFTQVACQFLESENGVNHGYQTTRAADCEAINARTGDERLKRARVVHLKAGRYVFKVTNRDVPYALGFWLRGDGVLNRARLPSISGGGLTPGVTKDYPINLKPGEYVYSGPLNPTPDYKLIVSG